jgi:PAS domain S-box-containing protein
MVVLVQETSVMALNPIIPTPNTRGSEAHMTARKDVRPTGRESPFNESEIIVSKTDLKGRITYVNDVFLRVSRYTHGEILGQPHSIIRHPDMPRCVFKLLWDAIQSRGELFAYVVNMASNGDHYWVLAHVTPSFDAAGNVIGYHSNRRKPDAAQVAKIVPLYRSLLDEEKKNDDRKVGMKQAHELLQATLEARGVGYDQFVFSI